MRCRNTPCLRVRPLLSVSHWRSKYLGVTSFFPPERTVMLLNVDLSPANVGVEIAIISHRCYDMTASVKVGNVGNRAHGKSPLLRTRSKNPSTDRSASPCKTPLRTLLNNKPRTLRRVVRLCMAPLGVHPSQLDGDLSCFRWNKSQWSWMDGCRNASRSQSLSVPCSLRPRIRAAAAPVAVATASFLRVFATSEATSLRFLQRTGCEPARSHRGRCDFAMPALWR